MKERLTFTEALSNKSAVMGRKLRIGWFYPEYLNLYGDSGNIEVLVCRARERGVSVEVEKINLDSSADASLITSLNLVFMGGGPDLGQQKIYQDFLLKKGPYLKEYLENGGVGLFICGSYQLLGKYYKGADGSVMEGLSFLDFYTEHFGKGSPRSVGNLTVDLHHSLKESFYFKTIVDSIFGDSSSNTLSDTSVATGFSYLVGFENHGGRTYLGKSLTPLGYTKKEFGNNDSDHTEGVLYKNTIGTYLHGPVLAKNPHLADYLIAKALRLEDPVILGGLNDSVIISAHQQALHLKR